MILKIKLHVVTNLAFITIRLVQRKHSWWKYYNELGYLSNDFKEWNAFKEGHNDFYAGHDTCMSTNACKFVYEIATRRLIWVHLRCFRQGDHPTALFLMYQEFNLQRSIDMDDACRTCGTVMNTQKCSKCRMVGIFIISRFSWLLGILRSIGSVSAV